jgi:hypothetical protein
MYVPISKLIKNADIDYYLLHQTEFFFCEENDLAKQNKLKKFIFDCFLI